MLAYPESLFSSEAMNLVASTVLIYHKNNQYIITAKIHHNEIVGDVK